MTVRRPPRARGPAPSPRVQADVGRPLVVAVDTSCAIETLALVQGDLVLAQWHARRPKHRGASLATTLAALLDSTGRSLPDLSGAVVAVGPGAFTGLRVGIATLQGVCSSLGVPLYPVSSLPGWARASGAPRVGVTLDARRGELYTALYEGGVEVRGLDLQTPEAWAAELAGVGPVELVGDGAVLHAEQLLALAPRATVAPLHVAGPNLAAAALDGVRRLAAGEPGDPRAIAPIYLRRHDGTRTPAPA